MKSSSLSKNIVYNDNKPLISILFETETTKEIRIVMKEKQLMKEHKTSFPITVEIFEGAVDFGVEGTVRNLVKGDLVYLEANIPHDLIAKKDKVERVIKVSES